MGSSRYAHIIRPLAHIGAALLLTQLVWACAAVLNVDFDTTHEKDGSADNADGGPVTIDGCTLATCKSKNTNCGVQDDGCGGTLNCGTCTNGDTCKSGQCACANKKTCTDLKLACGNAPDGCGGSLDCGKCSGANEGCVNGACVCQPQTCKVQGAECGKISDGCGGTYDCGPCMDVNNPNCGGNGPNKCGKNPCVPKKCGQGDCGTISDGCGNTIMCPMCTLPETCGGGGMANKCGCTPVDGCLKNGWDCNSAPDGCGGTKICGKCAGFDSCGGGGKQNVCGCTPSNVACNGKNCGVLADGCGNNISCGPNCAGFDTCGGGGVPNVCGCTPTTCMANGWNCGTPQDGCGKTLASCGPCFISKPRHQCVGYQCIIVCPYVFSFDGEKFAYETSVGGASVVGKKIDLVQGKKVEFEPMWARLDHASIQDGVLRTKVIAAEDEIVYFDAAKLTTVEHLPGYEIISSSSIQWNTLEKADPREIIALRTSTMRAPISASWRSIADVTADLGTQDDRAAAFDVREANYYDVDFGAVRDVSQARLVIDGWKYKEARDLMADVAQVRPHLDVRQPDGTYKKVMELSTPRGDKKTIAFDLSRVSFPTGRYEVRVWTGTHEDGNAMWYLDRVRVSEDPKGPITVRDVPLAHAELDFVGAPSEPDVDNHSHPRIAIDDAKGELLAEQRTWGAFTRYGDVRELLGSSDDRMVVMRRGDGVTMRFNDVPRASAGHELTAFLMTDLVFKPRKWLTSSEATPMTENVEPLPYHGMGFYPPTTSFPSDAAHQLWRADYQTRVYERGDPRWGR